MFRHHAPRNDLKPDGPPPGPARLLTMSISPAKSLPFSAGGATRIVIEHEGEVLDPIQLTLIGKQEAAWSVSPINR